jgi:hypothetical protein
VGPPPLGAASAVEGAVCETVASAVAGCIGDDVDIGDAAVAIVVEMLGRGCKGLHGVALPLITPLLAGAVPSIPVPLAASSFRISSRPSSSDRTTPSTTIFLATVLGARDIFRNFAYRDMSMSIGAPASVVSGAEMAEFVEEEGEPTVTLGTATWRLADPVIVVDVVGLTGVAIDEEDISDDTAIVGVGFAEFAEFASSALHLDIMRKPSSSVCTCPSASNFLATTAGRIPTFNSFVYLAISRGADAIPACGSACVLGMGPTDADAADKDATGA